jgi:SLIDE
MAGKRSLWSQHHWTHFEFPGTRTGIYMLLRSKTRQQWRLGNTIRCSRKNGNSCLVCQPYVSLPTETWTKYLSEYPRIAARIAEGEAKRNKRDNLEYLLTKKIASVRYPMQELELNYPTTKGKVYSEEEDRYLLCRLNYYGMRADDVYERIKKDITEFPVFRFDWFFKSRSPQELQRRCNTLLGMIEKEAETKQQEEVKTKGTTKGKVSLLWSLATL